MRLPVVTNKCILIAPLDWGIGHATRCVPLIEHLQGNNTVLIGVTPANQLFFKTLFPHLKCVELPAYNVHYHRYLPAWLAVFLQRKTIRKVIAHEHWCLNQLLNEEPINYIISDNRFGCYHSTIYSVYVTHQLFVRPPFFKRYAQRINQRYMEAFQEVWVPDFENEAQALSGRLSHGALFHKRVRYIEPISRLKKIPSQTFVYDYLLILSGPEPQQTIFKELFIKCASKYPTKRIAIAQTNVSNAVSNNMVFINGTHPEKLAQLIVSSKTIICRSGYSTLMDLHLFLPLDIILVPTPGQPEQIYLAAHWQQRFACRVVQQHLLETLILH